MKSSASASGGISRTLRYTMNFTIGARVRMIRSRVRVSPKRSYCRQSFRSSSARRLRATADEDDEVAVRVAIEPEGTRLDAPIHGARAVYPSRLSCASPGLLISGDT